MSSPRDPNRDLRLERLGDRDGRRPAHLGEAALVGSSLGSAASAREYRAAYQALIDAVFTAPGAAEWLAGLRRAFGGEGATRPRAAGDAIRAAEPGPGRA
jgi:hypothetical protein